VFENRVLGPSTQEEDGERCTDPNEDAEIKKVEMDGTCSTHGGNESL
jgi:hypothetical protein